MTNTVTIYVNKEDHDDILDEYEVATRYDDTLNEIYGVVNVAGYEYETARTLKEIDPIAYRTGMNDWADGEFYELECPADIWENGQGSDEAIAEWIDENV